MMRVATGTISNGNIILDKSPALPDKTRVRVVIESMGPELEEGATVPQTREEVELVRKARKRLARITHRQ